VVLNFLFRAQSIQPGTRKGEATTAMIPLIIDNFKFRFPLTDVAVPLDLHNDALISPISTSTDAQPSACCKPNELTKMLRVAVTVESSPISSGEGAL
jgi:hypothetical protein